MPDLVSVGSSKGFDIYERSALVETGDKAGSFLDSIGKTDLAELSPEQWVDFLKRVVDGFGDSIRAQIRSGKPPF